LNIPAKLKKVLKDYEPSVIKIIEQKEHKTSNKKSSSGNVIYIKIIKEADYVNEQYE